METKNGITPEARRLFALSGKPSAFVTLEECERNVLEITLRHAIAVLHYRQEAAAIHPENGDAYAAFVRARKHCTELGIDTERELAGHYHHTRRQA